MVFAVMFNLFGLSKRSFYIGILKYIFYRLLEGKS